MGQPGLYRMLISKLGFVLLQASVNGYDLHLCFCGVAERVAR